jgi:hypothetical protein
VQQETEQRQMQAEAGLDAFLDDPSGYFGHSLTRMMGNSRADVDALQLAGLRRRFGRFRGRIGMLDKLADRQGIHAIDRLDDVVPLLFGHEIYKSYPASLLEKHRFRELTAWLNKLTTHDLSKVDVSSCRSIDDWLMTMSRETPMAVVHTSGTGGTMSFLPWTKAEWRRCITQFTVLSFQRFGQPAPLPRYPMNIECIYPFFRSGGLSHTVLNDAVVEVIAGGEERFHAAYPGRLSADLLVLAARRRSAAAKGELDRLDISPELAARREEFELQQRDMPGHVARFFDTLRQRLAGQRIFMLAASHMLYGLAESGLKQGMQNLFSADSVIISGGGGKGMVLPDGWSETVKTFFGTRNLVLSYGMSEMAGQFAMCDHGHYHCPPWIIPFVLDPDTAKALPRHGTVTGRFAFYDLLPDTRWGGFVSGDEVTLSWDPPCPCGRTGAYVHSNIQRLSDRRTDEGEEKLSCAAAPEAYAEALDFLNEGLV